MKKNRLYNEPQLEIVLLGEDVITSSTDTWTSNTGTLGGDGTTTDGNTFENVFGQ